VTLKQALARARETLGTNSIPDASLESELLLRHVLKMDRVQLYLELDSELHGEKEQAFWESVARRLKGEPTAYLTGCREFYGLDFYVDRRVLIPRPESELLVEKALALAERRTISTVADIGTGCGAIAISLAMHLPGVRIYATDISSEALAVARSNSEKHGVQNCVCFLQGDLLAPLPGPVDIIVANLPYVREEEVKSKRLADFEPELALDGGADGLDRMRKLCRQAKGRLTPSGCLLLEIGQGQADAITGLLRGLFPTALLEVAPDLAGIARVVSLYLTSESVNAKLVG
jgi:release factor glutamine methyltransferase